MSRTASREPAWSSSADLFGQTLAAHGVRQVFTLVGSHISPLLAGCVDAGLLLIDTRHEASAGHAAEGYAKATGCTAVCLVTAGPGFTNILTPLASCLVDAVPALFVAGAAPLYGTVPNPLQGGFSQIEVARPIAKWVARAQTPEQIPELLSQALAIARSGRPGPVFIEIPVDVAHGRAAACLPAGQPEATGSAPPPDARIIEEVIERLRRAQRPLILAGGGIKYSAAADELRHFVKRTGIPVLSNFNAHGAVTADDPAWAGPFSALLPAPLPAPADLLLVLGARFGLLTGGFPGRFADRETQVVQIDIEASELNHLRDSDLGIVGDCRAFLAALNHRLNDSPQPMPIPTEWAQTLRTARARSHKDWQTLALTDVIHPFQLARTVVASLPRDTLFVADGGEAKAWIEMNIAPQRMGQYISRAYSGTLGSGQGLALGAQIANPGNHVCLFIGDGAWGFYLQEIDTFMRHRLPIITVVVNNGCWGSIRHGQQRLWDSKRFLATDLGYTRYDQIARGFGCHAEYVTRIDALGPALRRAQEHDGPSVINVIVDPAPDPASPPTS